MKVMVIKAFSGNIYTFEEPVCTGLCDNKSKWKKEGNVHKRNKIN